MTNMTNEQLLAYGRNEKKQFLKRQGYWPCSIFEFNQVSLYYVKLYFRDASTKEIITFLKQQLKLDYEIIDIEKNFVHLHCLYMSETDLGLEALEFELSNQLQSHDTYQVHWLG